MEDHPIRNLGALLLGANIKNKKNYFIWELGMFAFIWTLLLEFYEGSSILFLRGLLLEFWIIYKNPLLY